jgi:hypothetical protein
MSDKNSLPAKGKTKNPSIFTSLSLENEVTDWGCIAHGIDLLMVYALRGMADDSALSDPTNLMFVQSVLFFKNDVDKLVSKTLSEISE